MKIVDLAHMSTPDLLAMMRAISAEIEQRLNTPIEQREQAVQPVKIIREPGDDDKMFCLQIAQCLRRGEYIKADERRRVAEIAQEFPAWVKKQWLPLDSGTGSWGKAARMWSSGFAKER